MEKTDLAQRIKTLRMARGETQVEFRAYFGVKQATVSDWEHGKYEPESQHFITLGRLSFKAGDDPWYFWGFAGLTRADVLRALDQPVAVSPRSTAERQKRNTTKSGVLRQ